MIDVQREAEVLSTYLLGSACDAATSQRYTRAVAARAIEMSPAQAELWARALRSARMLRLVDAGLALLDRYSPIRQRIAIMFAVAEAQPRDADAFLPRDYKAAEMVALALRALIAVSYSLAGASILRLRFREACGR